MFKRWIFAVSVALGLSGVAHGQINWDTAGNGNWEDVANWSTGALPGAADDVVIDQGGGFTITIDDSVPAVQSLMSVENLAFGDNRDLTIQNGGTVSGSITFGQNTELTINGGSFAATGAATLDGGNVFANGGSTVDLSTVASYLTDTGSNFNRRFTANGASAIDLSGMTEVTGGGFIRRLEFNANGGSSINLSALTGYLGGATHFAADGSGSTIDISALADMTSTSSNSFSQIGASDGGTINANSLTTISASQGNRNRIVIDGAGSTLNASALATATNTRLQLTNGGTHDFSGITSFDGSDALADGGVTLDLTGVTSYDVNNGGNQSRLVTANGTGTLVDLSNLVDVTGGTFIRSWNVTAEDGGEVDLSAMTNYVGGTSRFTADGTGSSIDISATTNVTNDNSTTFGFLQVADGGTINANSLTAYEATQGSRARIIVDGAGSTLNASSLTDAENTQIQLTNGGTHDFSGINSFNGGSALADSGVTLDLTGVTGSYDTNAGGNQDRQFTSDGAGTVVDLSNVTSVVGGGFIRALNVNATNGAEVDLSGVSDISGGAVNMLSDGAGSLVDASSLQSFNDSNNNRTSTAEAVNGGVIEFGANDLVLTNVAVGVNAGGLINANSIELIRDGSTDSGSEDDAMLFGDNGTVVADVFNTSGIVSPGNSDGGTITIDGDYTQGIDGTMNLEIFDVSTFDKLFVLGNTDLDGDLLVTIDSGFDLGADMDFLVLDVGGTLAGNFAGFSQGAIVTSDNGFDLRIDYLGGDGNDVVLTTALVAVPEPSSMIVIGAALLAMTVRRKRNN